MNLRVTHLKRVYMRFEKFVIFRKFKTLIFIFANFNKKKLLYNIIFHFIQEFIEMLTIIYYLPFLFWYQINSKIKSKLLPFAKFFDSFCEKNC